MVACWRTSGRSADVEMVASWRGNAAGSYSGLTCSCFIYALFFAFNINAFIDQRLLVSC